MAGPQPFAPQKTRSQQISHAVFAGAWLWFGALDEVMASFLLLTAGNNRSLFLWSCMEASVDACGGGSAGVVLKKRTSDQNQEAPAPASPRSSRRAPRVPPAPAPRSSRAPAPATPPHASHHKAASSANDLGHQAAFKPELSASDGPG
jgi:hypothetical protein